MFQNGAKCFASFTVPTYVFTFWIFLDYFGDSPTRIEVSEISINFKRIHLRLQYISSASIEWDKEDHLTCFVEKIPKNRPVLPKPVFQKKYKSTCYDGQCVFALRVFLYRTLVYQNSNAIYQFRPRSKLPFFIIFCILFTKC